MEEDRMTLREICLINFLRETNFIPHPFLVFHRLNVYL